jgi:CDGSH-type Zn-finger protein
MTWKDANPTSARQVTVTPCSDGPVLVRGADEVLDADGQRHRVERPVVAVCVCGKSSRKPWCDGTHKVTPKAAKIRRFGS